MPIVMVLGLAWAVVAFALEPTGTLPKDPVSDPTLARRRMVEVQIRGRGIRDSCVIRAMEHVPRHRFVPQSGRAHAYEDRALPIGREQSISQPYMVALMTELLDLDGTERVLEIGTGSGYQAAILAECAREVFTVEIRPELAREAENRLRAHGYERVRVRLGDGHQGWVVHAPYDAIMITAAAPEIPPMLVGQLREGGILVMPRGRPPQRQILIRGLKRAGRLETRELMPVAFVPLVEGLGHMP